jgi:hypothetical protein
MANSGLDVGEHAVKLLTRLKLGRMDARASRSL